MTKRIVLAVAVTVLWLTSLAAAQPGTPADRFYGQADYLLWWVKDGPQSIPLVTDGVITAPTTRVFLGGDDVEFDHQHGARLTLGYWLTPDRAWGVEVSGFYLPRATERASVASSGEPGSVNLVVPFFNAIRNEESFTFVSEAGLFSGQASTRASSRLWGAEGHVVFGATQARPFRVELLGGFRYLNLSEDFVFKVSSPDLPPGPVTVFDTVDVFDAGNQFYGGQIGVRGRYRAGRVSADATLKVALGAMRQHLDVAGSLTTNFFDPTTVQTFASGIFAQPTNSGRHSRTAFAVVPEAAVNVGVRLTDWMSVVVGYTFLYASNVARPGNHIDRVINPNQAPAISTLPPAPLNGPARPAFKFDGSDFWAHGLNVGVTFNF